MAVSPDVEARRPGTGCCKYAGNIRETQTHFSPLAQRARWGSLVLTPRRARRCTRDSIRL